MLWYRLWLIAAGRQKANMWNGRKNRVAYGRLAPSVRLPCTPQSLLRGIPHFLKRHFSISMVL